MYTRQETIDLLQHIIEAEKTNSLMTPDSERINSYRSILKKIINSEFAESAYRNIALFSNVYQDDIYVSFEDIWYREDCFEYLLSQDFSYKEAKRLTDIIRMGLYCYDSHQIFKDRLSDDFINWAVKTCYLTSRYTIYYDFYREYEEMKFSDTYILASADRTYKELEKLSAECLSESPENLHKHSVVKDNSSIIDKYGNQTAVSNYIAEKLLKSNVLEGITHFETSEYHTYLCGYHHKTEVTKPVFSYSSIEELTMNLYNFHPHDEMFLYAADYQVPVNKGTIGKGDTSELYGKIDLITVDQAKKEIYLMKVEMSDSTNSLLSSILEIYTYFKQIDKVKLSREIGEKYEFRLTGFFKVKPAILVFEGKEQHLQLRSKLFKSVQKLMFKLGIKAFIIQHDVPYGHTGFYDIKYNNLRITEVQVDCQ